MIKIIKKNKACPPSRMFQSQPAHEGLAGRRGFVILFAVTLSAIFLSVALGGSNIALKESKFSTSAKETNDAFFAAGSGVEYVYYKNINDNPPFCSYTLGDPTDANCPTTSVSNLGNSGDDCARVDATKSTNNNGTPLDTSDDYVLLTITSKGYNNSSPSCPPTANYVEREIKAFFRD